MKPQLLQCIGQKVLGYEVIGEGIMMVERSFIKAGIIAK